MVELDTPVNRAFRDAYRKKYNEDPEEFSVMGYDAMRFIFEAVKARGGDTKDRPALVSAIEKVAYTGPRGPMKMAKNHQATMNVYIVKTVEKARQCRLRSDRHLSEFRGPGEGLQSQLIAAAMTNRSIPSMTRNPARV